MTATKTKASCRKKKVVKDEGTLGGFTIIEVVLVLAIAGLIFLMVFIALPALQRSQRDTQRGSDMSKLAGAIMNYQKNNNGRLPADSKQDPIQEVDGVVLMTNYNCNNGSSANAACRVIKDYINGVSVTDNEWVDPDGFAYGLAIVTYGSGAYTEGWSPDYDHTFYMVKSSRCDGETIRKSDNSRDYAVLYRMEGSGVSCQDNG